MKIKLSEKSKKELKEIEDKIRGDMSDEDWEFLKTVRCIDPNFKKYSAKSRKENSNEK